MSFCGLCMKVGLTNTSFMKEYVNGVRKKGDSKEVYFFKHNWGSSHQRDLDSIKTIFYVKLPATEPTHYT